MKKPDPQSIPDTLDAPQMREVFRRKMRYAVDMVGSINKACALIGVNRTQFNRYLNGQSMPRVELLYRFSKALSLPFDWFFDPDDDFETALSAHRYGMIAREIVRDHRFRISDESLPNGFYLLWKGTFDGSSDYEAMLGVVEAVNGVKTFRASKFRRMKLRGPLSDFERRDLFLHMAVERSANGIRLSTSDGEQNHIYSFFLRLRAPLVGDRFSTVFSGAGISGAFGGEGRQSLVPTALERVGDTPQSVLAAARQAIAYSKPQLPPHIAFILDEVGVPHFALK